MMQKAGGYELVDHILTNGLAYIDTGYFVNPNTEVELFCRMERNANTAVGTVGKTYSSAFFTTPTEAPYIYQLNQGGNPEEWTVYYLWPNIAYDYGGATNDIKSQASLSSDISIGYRYEGGKYVGYVGDVSKVVTKPVHTFVSNSLLLLSGSSNRPYHLTDLYFYHFKIMEQGKVIKHFVPAKKGDIYGMAEIIEGKFYASPNGESFDY